MPLALRLIGAARHPELLDTEYFYLRTELRIDSIAFGVLAASLCEMPRGRALIQFLIRPLPVAAAVLVLIFCFAYREPFFRETLRYSLLAAAIAVGMSAIVFSARYAPANWLLNAAPVVWVGRLSYSLYVWHLATGEAVKYEFSGPAARYRRVAALAACVAMAALSYYALEQPLIGLRRRSGRERRKERLYLLILRDQVERAPLGAKPRRPDGRRPAFEGQKLSRRVDRGLFHFGTDILLELLEVGLEALGQVARGVVVGLLVRPGVARSARRPALRGSSPAPAGRRTAPCAPARP